jgi:hypothetical protein
MLAKISASTVNTPGRRHRSAWHAPASIRQSGARQLEEWPATADAPGWSCHSRPQAATTAPQG